MEVAYLFMSEGVFPSKKSVYKTPNDIECGIIEVTLKKQKWLFSAFNGLQLNLEDISLMR